MSTARESNRATVGRIRQRLWHEGSARGARLAAFLETATGGLAGKRVLDLGCAEGGITQVLAERSGFAVGLDNRPENVEAAGRRLGGGDERLVGFVRGNALRLPFATGSFDVVLMSGLLEWMGFAMPDRDPGEAQRETLREVLRVLAPRGAIFVGIENRWFPKFLLRSPHLHLPLVMMLPNRLVWALPRWLVRQRVHERLYGERALRHLFEDVGFVDPVVYLPLFDYQFPREVVRGDDRTGLLEALHRTSGPPSDDFEVVAGGGRWGRRWMRLIATFGAARWLAPCLIVAGRKVAEGDSADA